MDRIQGSTATPSHTFTEGDPGQAIPATIVSASWLTGIQEEAIAIIEAAGIAPDAEVLNQVHQALEASYAPKISTATRLTTLEEAASNLVDAQVSTVDFSSLTDLLPAATATTIASIKAQYRLAKFRRANGVLSHASLEFHWSALLADSAYCGWTLNSKVGAMGAVVDAALRTAWGIGPTVEWPFPYLFGVIYTSATSHNISIMSQPDGPKFTIFGDVDLGTMHTFGRISIHVPGWPVA